jgi:hypothetical protein
VEHLTKIAWGLLALIHVSPAAVFFSPGLVTKLYRIESGGDLSTLLNHRGALFLAIVAACLFGAFDPSSRRAVSVIVAISVIGFLIVYARAGMPQGALRSIAMADAIALLPLVWVLYQAWRMPAA